MQNTASSWSKSITLLPWLSVMLSVFTLWGYVLMVMLTIENITVELAVAVIGAAAVVIAALIAGVVALIGQWRQLKQDGKTIDSIQKNTDLLSPLANRIHEDSAKSKDVLVETVVPKMTDIGARNQKIDFIASELAYHKRLKNDLSKGAGGRDTTLASINKVYEENARLNSQYTGAQEQLMRLMGENSSLNARNQVLESELEQAQREVGRLTTLLQQLGYEPEI